MARTSEYSPEVLEAAEDYVSGGWSEAGDLVPTVAGLAIEIGKSRETCYEWATHDDKAEFSDILTRIREIQERKLINGGLGNIFNPAVTKMMLTKHGYSDKQELDHTTNGKDMTPTFSTMYGKPQPEE